MRALIRGLELDRAQKNGEDGEESSRTNPNLMDSLVPKQCINFTDKQTDRQRGRQKNGGYSQTKPNIMDFNLQTCRKFILLTLVDSFDF